MTAGSGTTESGTLATGLTTNLYQFTGTAGELVYFEGLSDSPAYGAIAYFYSPSNSRVTDVYLENDTQVTLPFSGTYVLAVAGTERQQQLGQLQLRALRQRRAHPRPWS